MSVTNSNGYILPIDDLYASQKYGSKVENIADATGAFCTAAEPNADAFTVTAAQLLNGYIISGTGCAGAYTLTLPTGTVMTAACPTATIGSSFKVKINEVGGQAMTLTGAADMTVVGTATLAANRATVAVFICTSVSAHTWKAFLVVN